MPDPYRAHVPFLGGSRDAPSPLSLTVSLLHPAVEPGSELSTYAIAKIRAASNAVVTNRLLVSAVLVLDVSGSMNGEPIAQVLHSARRLAEILDDRDQLGIVTFSDGASIVAPLGPVIELKLRAPRESTLLRTLSCKLTGAVAGTANTFETVAYADTHVTLVAAKTADPVVHASVTVAKASEMRAGPGARGTRQLCAGGENPP